MCNAATYASSTLTLDVYSHVLPDTQQKAAERLEELLFSPSGAVERERPSRISDDVVNENGSGSQW